MATRPSLTPFLEEILAEIPIVFVDGSLRDIMSRVIGDTLEMGTLKPPARRSCSQEGIVTVALIQKRIAIVREARGRQTASSSSSLS